nr:hypothetical protein [Propionibacterium sp.]
MRMHPTALAALFLLSACAPAPASTPPAASTSDAPSATAPVAPPTPTTVPSSPGETSASPARPTGLPTPHAPTPDAPTPGPEDSLEAAFAQPERGGIGAFLNRHPDYLPGTVVIGEVIVSGSARGPLELTLTGVPAGTTRMFMTIACVDSRPYRMELSRADGTLVGASWADSCGYWGGLNGYTTTPFAATAPPTRFTITVDSGTRYSYVLYASPGR